MTDDPQQQIRALERRVGFLFWLIQGLIFFVSALVTLAVLDVL